MKPIAIALLIACLPALVWAEDDEPASPPLQLQNQPKFFSLDKMRNGAQPVVKTVGGTAPAPKTSASPALRSDSAAMKDGFFRIDRQNLAPSQIQHAIVVKPMAPSASGAPRVISGAPALTMAPSTGGSSLAGMPSLGGTPMGTMPSESSLTASGLNPKPLPLSAGGSNPVLSLFNSANPSSMPNFRETLLKQQGGVSAMPLPTDAANTTLTNEGGVLVNPQILPSTNAHSEKLIMVR